MLKRNIAFPHSFACDEVGVLPERRWTNPKGVTNQTKNALSLRLRMLGTLARRLDDMAAT